MNDEQIECETWCGLLYGDYKVPVRPGPYRLNDGGRETVPPFLPADSYHKVDGNPAYCTAACRDRAAGKASPTVERMLADGWKRDSGNGICGPCLDRRAPTPILVGLHWKRGVSVGRLHGVPCAEVAGCFADSPVTDDRYVAGLDPGSTDARDVVVRPALQPAKWVAPQDASDPRAFGILDPVALSMVARLPGVPSGSQVERDNAHLRPRWKTSPRYTSDESTEGETGCPHNDDGGVP